MQHDIPRLIKWVVFDDVGLNKIDNLDLELDWYEIAQPEMLGQRMARMVYLVLMEGMKVYAGK